jgi:hypothetical protein
MPSVAVKKGGKIFRRQEKISCGKFLDISIAVFS